MKYPISFLLLIFFFGKIGYAQLGNAPNDTLLSWIASKQIKADTFYQEGLFPSQRIGKKDQYEDNTLFYSALIANTLMSLSERVSPEDAELIDSIVLKVQNNMWRYRSRRGRATYNFWQTNPDIPHPNGPAKYQAEKYKIPDDFDDTSMIGLLIHDEEEVRQIRQEMIRYTSARKKKVKTALKPYRRSEAYGVWHADKWKQEFDICVMSNSLRLVFGKGFDLNRYDSATITMIKHMVGQDLHKEKPFLISPFYPRTAIILYHLTSLITADARGFFASLKSKIIQDSYAELRSNTNEWERLILLTSLMKLGESPGEQVAYHRLQEGSKEFYWYSANLMSAIGSGILSRRIFKTSSILPSLYWNCEAFNWTLYYEYLTYSREIKQ